MWNIPSKSLLTKFRCNRNVGEHFLLWLGQLTDKWITKYEVKTDTIWTGWTRSNKFPKTLKYIQFTAFDRKTRSVDAKLLPQLSLQLMRAMTIMLSQAKSASCRSRVYSSRLGLAIRLHSRVYWMIFVLLMNNESVIHAIVWDKNSPKVRGVCLRSGRVDRVARAANTKCAGPGRMDNSNN